MPFSASSFMRGVPANSNATNTGTQFSFVQELERLTGSLGRIGTTAADVYNSWRPVWSGQNPMLAPQQQPLYNGPTITPTTAPTVENRNPLGGLITESNQYLWMLGGVVLVVWLIARR